VSIVLQDAWLTVHHGDARAVLPTLEAGSVDAIVTSPPYWRQRSYLADDDPLKPLELGQEASFETWLEDLVAIARELRRVLDPRGSMWLVLGDKRVAYGGQRAGKIAGKREYLRAVPLDRPARDGYPAALRGTSLVLAPYRLAIALCDDGWILRDKVVWWKTNGIPESVGDRLSVREETIFRFTPNQRARFDLDAIRAPYSAAAVARSAPGRAKTFSGRKSAPAGQPARSPKVWTGSAGDNHRAAFFGAGGIRPDGKNPGNVWAIATSARASEGQRYAHPAMFPAELVRRPILATVRPGGVVLDPFAGTGTVAQVANDHLRRAVLIELDPSHA